MTLDREHLAEELFLRVCKPWNGDSPIECAEWADDAAGKYLEFRDRVVDAEIESIENQEETTGSMFPS